MIEKGKIITICILMVFTVIVLIFASNANWHIRVDSLWILSTLAFINLIRYRDMLGKDDVAKWKKSVLLLCGILFLSLSGVFIFCQLKDIQISVLLACLLVLFCILSVVFTDEEDIRR